MFQVSRKVNVHSIGLVVEKNNKQMEKMEALFA